MCIFSYSKNYIFFHIPKCGGTSVSELLNDSRSEEPFIYHTHFTYQKAKDVFTKKGKLEWFNQAYKFAVVRHPHSRMLSMYNYISKHTDHPLNKELNFSFNEFCKRHMNKPYEGVISCFDHLTTKSEEPDPHIHVFRLEDLQKQKKVYLKDDLIFNGIPHVNKTENNIEIDDESKRILDHVFAMDLITWYS
jgi:hypothetical protein